MRELLRLAELSHTVDRLATSLCLADGDERIIELQLVELADGEREAAAMALAYALRRRELNGGEPVNDRVIAALAGVVHRMARPPDRARDES